ncbi:MAG: nucleotidyltransferase domain-containing protein [Bacteroidia bacterium]|nr:nucleotidyltransferase domain-containing protein [Bacteroidia bacterium]
MHKIVSKEDKSKSLNTYIQEIIDQKKATPISIDNGHVQSLIKHIIEWAGNDFSEVFVAGSSAKGTALIGSSDLDLFISLKAGMSDRLEDNFHSLAEMFSVKKITFRRQNVSVRVTYYGLQIDLVPGKKKPRSRQRHTLYMHREENQDRIETNVKKHIKYVIESGRINEILAMKIWRDLNGLVFPSMYLEMYVIKALKGKWSTRKFLARNFLHVLEDLSKYIHSTAIYDPSNGSNSISNELGKADKNRIQKAAEESLNKEFMNEIIYFKK